jgi:Alpha/beta hydrolase domain
MQAKRFLTVCFAVGVLCQGLAPPAQARVTRIVIDDRQPLAASGLVPGQSVAYEQVAGRAFGELDPGDERNARITDIQLAREPDGRVRYVASFVLTKPVDMARASGLLWHDVPNRGRPENLAQAELRFGDVGLASAWQGDNAGDANNGTLVRPTMQVNGRHFLQLPVARNADGSAITGLVFGRIVNRAGPRSQGLIVQTNPVPYWPATLDTSKARLVSRAAESTTGVVTDEREIPASEWAWADCNENKPFPGTPDGMQICLRGGFNPALLYQVVYTAKDPYVLGIGFAAWRDVADFFRNAKADDTGAANPVAGHIKHSIGRGVSQSGNYLRGWLHMGFNQSESGKQVHEGLWPIIAGRRIALNFRWAQPDGVLELYQAGSEGPQWWLPAPDPVRGGPVAGILDRCTATKTCPKIVEHFGSAEVWALKLTPEWVGTDGKQDLPLPSTVRRYYIASSTHGGGGGGFNSSLPGQGLPNAGPACPGNNFGTGVLPANPVPHTQTVNAIRVHFRNWVMQGTAPPPSIYPTLAGRPGPDGRAVPDLVAAHKAAMGMPTLPDLRASLPEADFIMPVLDYDWGPGFNPLDGSGVASLAPPPIRRVLPMLVPRVDADGNEVGGVPVVLTDAPLGTYLGWNVTAGGARPFHQGQICNYAGGMLPFAKTRAEREARGDSRLSLEERYGNHAGYVAAVERAAQRAQTAGFLLADDAKALVDLARASAVLR